MNNAYDTLIIGAGLNGLTTAAYLAKAGQRVLILEQRDVIGGAAATEEIFPGFKFDTVTHNVVGLPMQVALNTTPRELNLAQYGLQLIDADPNIYAPLPDGEGITLWRDDDKTVESLRRFSPHDAARWVPFKTRVTKLAAVLAKLHAITPPRVGDLDAAQLWTLGSLGLKLRGLGKRDLPAFLRALAMPVQDLLDDEFENDLLKGALGSVGVRGIRLGPRGTGTAYNFLRGCTNNAVGATIYVRGGVGNLANALAQCAQAHGATIRTNAPVVHIQARKQNVGAHLYGRPLYGRPLYGRPLYGRPAVRGVVLASGEEISAPRVVSAIDPRRTFLNLIDPLQLDPTFVSRVRNIRMQGVVAKVNLALDALPSFRGASPEQLRGAIVIAPNLDYIERAYDAAKYGAMSPQPLLEVTIPTLSDPSRVPQGKHVMSVWVQYAPYKLEIGNWKLEKEKLGHWVIRALEEYAPNLQSVVLHSQILTPCDLEETYGVTEGDLNHGQIALDQFWFMRPVPGFAQYHAPLDGLYLCGAGAHPGGLPCAAGRNAAREISKRS